MRVVRIITGMSLLTLFFVMGCRDVFEKDISEKEVVLVAPADSVETTRATLTFAWEERDGATGYRLVVVSPSFDRIELYVLDTLVRVYVGTGEIRVGREAGELGIRGNLPMAGVDRA